MNPSSPAHFSNSTTNSYRQILWLSPCQRGILHIIRKCL